MQELLTQIEQGYVGKRKGLFYTKYISTNFGKVFTVLFYHLGLTPNIVTLLSFLTVVAAVTILNLLAFNPVTVTLFAVLLQISYALDCSDGQLARLKGLQSDTGAWFDLLVDRASNYILVSGLFFWYLHQGVGIETSALFLIFMFCMFTNLFYSYAANLKNLMVAKVNNSSGDSGFLRELVFSPSDTGVFFWVVTFSLFSIHIFIAYSVYKLVLLTTVLFRTLLRSNSRTITIFGEEKKHAKY